MVEPRACAAARMFELVSGSAPKPSPSIGEGIARACRAGMPVRIGKRVKHGLDKGNDGREAVERPSIRHMRNANR